MQLDEVMGTATAISGRVSEQSQLFENIGDKVLAVGAKFPAVNGIINAVRRKKSKVPLYVFGSHVNPLSGHQVQCMLFTI